MKKDYDRLSREYGEAKAAREAAAKADEDAHRELFDAMRKAAVKKWGLCHAFAKGGLREFAVERDGDGFKSTLFTLLVAPPTTVSHVRSYGKDADDGAASRDAVEVPVRVVATRVEDEFRVTSPLLGRAFLFEDPGDADEIDEFVDLLYDSVRKEALARASGPATKAPGDFGDLDPLLDKLLSFVEAAEGELTGKSAGIGVVLSVSGLIVSGQLVSHATFFREFAKSSASALDKSLGGAAGDGMGRLSESISPAPDARPVRYVHLRNAAAIAHNGLAVPGVGNNGGLWRLKAESIDGLFVAEAPGA
jgi:hypothetical protein